GSVGRYDPVNRSFIDGTLRDQHGGCFATRRTDHCDGASEYTCSETSGHTTCHEEHGPAPYSGGTAITPCRKQWSGLRNCIGT
ncbi:MAG: hypothetical protein ACREP9_02980, partial [Candidatus Dormibacteraceae bacterium]